MSKTMKKIGKWSFPLLIAIALMALAVSCKQKEAHLEPAAYVDPFIGTDAHGHTYPGATMPFGMVQLSPDTRLGGWDGASGYHYSDSVIYGFTHTALNGTGVGDYGDILLMPVIGEPKFINDDYLSSFLKENEHAEAGYYSVFLDKPGVLAEMTATTRVGYHRYTFPEGAEATIMIDLEHRDRVTDAWIEFVSDTEIRGLRRSTNWANDLVWYFHMEFSKPFVRQGIAIDNELQDGLIYGQGLNVKAFVGFDVSDNEPVEVKVSLSAVDPDGAYNNMQVELPGWGFDQVREDAFNAWNEALGRIRVKGGTKEQKTVFYTALYHAYLQPNTFMDVDRRYRGMDKSIHVAEDFTNYTIFSLWDTYRTWHPLMTIIETERSVDFVRVMLDMYEKGGLLPVWELAANETFTMIGYHSVSVIADAFMKNLRDYDTEKALEAMINSAMKDHLGLDSYRKYGYIPGDKYHESISKTLEYAYNDWCIAQVAKEMGREDIYREFIKRAQFYKNIFDPTTGFMRPKLNGNWLTPFDPTTVDWHFTEANSWQYSFYVPHDVTGFYTLHGGKENLVAKIDELFSTKDPITGRDMKDITGLIGQYAHGNEPSHHMAYLYNYLNQPWKTQQRVRQIMDEQYSHLPDGLAGNEDCGQMSAWLIMSAMGFYPVAPGAPEYIIGTPWFEEMEIFLENGKVFKITANKVSKKNFYIQSASLNGQEHPYSYISHEAIMNGGHLHFEMGSKPNKNWASSDEHVPVSFIKDELIVPVPFIVSDEARIRESKEIEIGTVQEDVEVFYTLDGTVPTRESIRYEGPITLDRTVTVKAVTYNQALGYSFPTAANFVKLNIERSVEILSEWHPNYHGGGAEALIDGLRGSENWRLGGWQGYSGTDFEAIVDLGKIEPVNYIAAGFVQEIRSWIWMPSDVSFYVSTDGENFNRVAFIQTTVPIDDYTVVQKDYGARIKTQARYVKVKATNFGTIPQWHLGAGGDAYIFIDEIIVE
jgi:predicted alpha-1,2-mannosidase